MRASSSDKSAGDDEPGGRPLRRLGAAWRWHNIVRVARSVVASFRTSEFALSELELYRLRRAERRGLQLYIACRSALFAVALAWYAGSALASGMKVMPFGVIMLVALSALGIVYYRAVRGRFQPSLVCYAIVIVDVAALCALFAFIPVVRGADVPQIYAFRNSNVLILLPLVALATLTLSPRLVLWSGLCAVTGWIGAYVYVVAGMDHWVSWSALPAAPDRAQYEAVILAPDFIARGSRMTEAILALLITIVLAITVARARRVFYAQVAAEAQRERERAARAEVRDRLGRFVPAAIADRIISEPSALEPRVRHAAALFMDITGFSTYAHSRDPGEVIAALNAFLALCADEVAREGGVVISFTGDGLLATFNTPLDIDTPERAALETGRTLLACGRTHGFHVRVGIAAGDVASGSVGSAERQAFTVYGDTVNRAARLEELAKLLGVPLLADAACASAVPELEPHGAHNLRGVGEAVPVWRDRASPPADGQA